MTPTTAFACGSCGEPVERTFDDEWQHTTTEAGVACTAWPVRAVPVPDSDALDFRAWIDSLTSEQITAGISKAIREHDWQAVDGLLKILAIKDPEKAQIIYNALCIATARHDRTAAATAATAAEGRDR